MDSRVQHSEQIIVHAADIQPILNHNKDTIGHDHDSATAGYSLVSQQQLEEHMETFPQQQFVQVKTRVLTP